MCKIKVNVYLNCENAFCHFIPYVYVWCCKSTKNILYREIRSISLKSHTTNGMRRMKELKEYWARFACFCLVDATDACDRSKASPSTGKMHRLPFIESVVYSTATLLTLLLLLLLELLFCRSFAIDLIECISRNNNFRWKHLTLPLTFSELVF